MIDSWNDVASETYPNWLNWDGKGFSYQGWSVDRPSSCWKHQQLKLFFWKVYSYPRIRWITSSIGAQDVSTIYVHTTRTSTPKGGPVGSFLVKWSYWITQVGEYHSTGGISISCTVFILNFFQFTVIVRTPNVPGGFGLTGLWPLGNFGCLRWWRFGSWNRLQASDWGKG